MKSLAGCAQRRFTLFFGLLAALFSQSGQAIVGGSGVDANTAGSFWSGVVSISIGGGVYSGVLLDNGYILTAAHVAASGVSNPGGLTVNFNAGSSLSQSISAESVTVYSGYTGTKVGSDGFWHDDLALIKLSSAAPSSATGYSLYSGSSVTTNTTMTLVGYGGSASVKRVGQNKIDYLVADDDGTTKTEILLFDFDGSTNATNVMGGGTLGANVEAQYAGGDSGSPMFVQVNGQWQLIGIASFNGTVKNSDGTPYSTSNTTFGSIGGATSVAAYSSWINTVSAVPEPQSYAMLLAGLGLLGLCVRRRSL